MDIEHDSMDYTIYSKILQGTVNKCKKIVPSGKLCQDTLYRLTDLQKGPRLPKRYIKFKLSHLFALLKTHSLQAITIADDDNDHNNHYPLFEVPLEQSAASYSVGIDVIELYRLLAAM